jgi:hypothetical protein
MENNTNTNEFSPEASLKVIYEMIESAKTKIGRNYFYFLFWGYLVAFTCIMEYILIVLENPKHYLLWPVLMMAGTIVTLIFMWKEQKSATSKSFIGTTMGFLWSGWFISFAILILFVNLRKDWGLILPMIMTMYGLAIFVAGGVINFRPLLIGAVVAWIASVVAFFVPYPVQLMILAGLVIVSHVIPGHILRNNSKA